MSMFAEVRNDYIYSEPHNGIRMGIAIDAWGTDCDDEEGRVVANVVLTEKSDIVVVWNNNAARYDPECLIAIEEAKTVLIGEMLKEEIAQ